MARAAEPPSGTRDFLADEVRRREHAFAQVREVFERYGFDPLVTPAFERIETLLGKYGDEGDKLVFKILRRGEHEASGEADMALRYDMTVPLARVVATHGGKLPSPYKRYAIGPVWRADRPGKGRFREFIQCDIDTVGSSSDLADAEILAAVHDGVRALGVDDFTVQLNSRQALHGLLEAYGVPSELGGGALITLDKLDKMAPDAVAAELVSRGVQTATADALVVDIASTDRVRERLDGSDLGKRGLAEVDRILELTDGLPVEFTPRMVRGLDYYTGMIFEVSAAGYPGSIASGGRYDGLVAALGGPDQPAVGGSIGLERILSAGAADVSSSGVQVALTVLGDEAALARLAGELRGAGVRTAVYLGTSGKLGKQLKWANGLGASFVVLYGADEQAAGEVTVRDMATGDQARVRLSDAAGHLARRVAERG